MWSEIFCDVLFEPEERPPQSNKTQDASLPRDAVSALVFHICDIWKLWGADALSMSNDHLARELGLLHPPHQPPHVHEGRVGVLLGRCWDPPDGSGCAGRRSILQTYFSLCYPKTAFVLPNMAFISYMIS